MARETQLPGNGIFLRSDLRDAIKKTLGRRQETLLGILGGALLLSTAPAMAQEQGGEELEEVVVTGLRGSLQASMDTKRDAIGVVDAINAEDIGKFPDSNLSESLQRITGISISRRDGEGALVTARGFGAQYNMVTLNGRMMPAADAFCGGNARHVEPRVQLRQPRLGSISGVEVYKTSKATSPPAASAPPSTCAPRGRWTATRFNGNFGVKAVHDTTNRVGDDVTPELSGIFSFANDDADLRRGSERQLPEARQRAPRCDVNDWHIHQWVAPAQPGAMELDAGAAIYERAGGRPAVRHAERHPLSLLDRERERTNGQLTLQFEPVDSLTADRRLHVRREQSRRRSRRPDAWMHRRAAPSRSTPDRPSRPR